MIQMFDNIAWQSILHSDQHLNYFVEIVATHLKDFNDPRKNSAAKNHQSPYVATSIRWKATK